MIQRGHKIHEIKEYRKLYKFDVKQVKDAIEALGTRDST